eukprot:3941912-Rhodomonas_salina.2
MEQEGRVGAYKHGEDGVGAYAIEESLVVFDALPPPHTRSQYRTARSSIAYMVAHHTRSQYRTARSSIAYMVAHHTLSQYRTARSNIGYMVAHHTLSQYRAWRSSIAYISRSIAECCALYCCLDNCTIRYVSTGHRVGKRYLDTILVSSIIACFSSAVRSRRFPSSSVGPYPRLVPEIA